MQIFTIFFTVVLINNIVLSRFLGICPFLGVSKKVETAMGMGVAVTFVMTVASAATYIVYNLILVKLEITYLYTIAFILVIASIVQVVEMFMKKSSPTLYQALGVYLPLITTNCAVLGVAVINMQEEYDLIISVVNGASSGLSFTLAIVLYAGIRERIESNNIPAPFRGFPIALIAAGLMAISFLGFQGFLQ